MTKTGAERPSVAAIVLNWCERDLTAACLTSLRRSDYPRLRILLVDNGSPDGSGDALHVAFPDVDYLQTGRNLGYTGGNNRGIDWAIREGFEYVLLLNNDTEVAPDAITHLVAAAEAADRPGAVAPKILYHSEPDRIWFGGGDLSRVRVIGFHRAEGERDDPSEAEGVASASFLTGCCLLLPVPVLRDVGSLEEGYFAYAEDVELSMRLARAGYEMLYQPLARIEHHVPLGRVDPQPWQITLRDRNRRRTARRHLTRVERLGFLLFFYPSRLVHLMRYAWRGDTARARAILVGMISR